MLMLVSEREQSRSDQLSSVMVVSVRVVLSGSAYTEEERFRCKEKMPT